MHRRRVGILFDTVGAFGRGAFRGINRYCLLARHWTLQEPPLASHWAPVRWEDWPVDGFIMQINGEEMLRKALKLSVPIVNISGSLLDTPLPSVFVDDVAVGRLAAGHFIDRGFRSFAYLGRPDTGFSAKRKRGFIARLKEAGFPCEVHESWLELDDGTQVKWLRSLPHPTALFVYNDQRARATLQQCQQLGIAVPEQLAILGVDDDELFRDLGGLSLSSIQTPAEEVGYRAAALLDAMMEGGKPPRRPILLPPGLLRVRHSTDTLALHDPDMALAMRFIREHAHEAIQVRDVAKAALIGRRSLERRFRAALGRSPLDEIMRVRLDRARQLLIETNLKMPDIARRSGFASATYMATAFGRMYGMSPRAYRKRFARGGV